MTGTYHMVLLLTKQKPYLNSDEFSDKHNKFSWSYVVSKNIVLIHSEPKKSLKPITYVHRGSSKSNFATTSSVFDSLILSKSTTPWIKELEENSALIDVTIFKTWHN